MSEKFHSCDIFLSKKYLLELELIKIKEQVLKEIPPKARYLLILWETSLHYQVLNVRCCSFKVIVFTMVSKCFLAHTVPVYSIVMTVAIQPTTWRHHQNHHNYQNHNYDCHYPPKPLMTLSSSLADYPAMTFFICILEYMTQSQML